MGFEPTFPLYREKRFANYNHRPINLSELLCKGNKSLCKLTPEVYFTETIAPITLVFEKSLFQLFYINYSIIFQKSQIFKSPFWWDRTDSNCDTTVMSHQSCHQTTVPLKTTKEKSQVRRAVLLIRSNQIRRCQQNSALRANNRQFSPTFHSSYQHRHSTLILFAGSVHITTDVRITNSFIAILPSSTIRRTSA